MFIMDFNIVLLVSNLLKRVLGSIPIYYDSLHIKAGECAHHLRARW